MTKRFKTAFASLAVATLCTLGTTSQASAFDLLEELLGGGKYADSYGASQKSGGHVQRCGSNCGGKGVSGHAQRSGGKGLGGHVQHAGGSKGGLVGGHAQRGGKGGHVQRGGKGGHVQRGGCDVGKGGPVQRGGKGGHVQRGGCDVGKGGPVQRGGCGGKGGQVQRGGKGGSFGGHAQRSTVSKGGSKGGGKGGKQADLFTTMRSHMANLKCKLSSYGGKGGKGGKGDFLDSKSSVYDGKSIVVPAPVIREEIHSVPVPGDPDPTT